MEQAEVTCACDRIAERRYRRDEASREDVFLDEIDVPDRALVKLVCDRDCLQQHYAVGLQQLAAFAEIRIDELMADRLDHFNRHGLVELTAKIAIVLEQHCDSIAKSLLG